MKPTIIEIVALLSVLLVIGINKVMQLDPDKGGYQPRSNLKATYPKWVVHGLAAYGLMFTMLVVDVRVGPAVVIETIAIFGFEWSQGFYNKWDAIAGFAGAAAALGIWILNT